MALSCFRSYQPSNIVFNRTGAHDAACFHPTNSPALPLLADRPTLTAPGAMTAKPFDHPPARAHDGAVDDAHAPTAELLGDVMG